MNCAGIGANCFVRIIKYELNLCTQFFPLTSVTILTEGNSASSEYSIIILHTLKKSMVSSKV
jgi:hypothetical protein